jgi:transposase
MGRAEVLQGVREMRFEGLLDRHERGELSQEEAAEMLGVSERTFRRGRDRLRDEGPVGLRDRRIGKPSSRRAAVEEIQRMLGLYAERYEGFTAKHFHEQLVKRHDYKLGYTVTRLALHGAGLTKPAPRRSAHRKKRPRRPLIGMMLHQDASRFAWLPGDARQYDLVVTLDDATSAIYSAFLVEEEGTASSFRGIAEVIARHGLFCELYTDRGSHYFHTPKAGEPVSKTVRTQVGRALAQLGIRHIAAYSPEARGRSERAFRTLQDRLPKELALAGIATLEAANRWIAETYLAAHNARFAVTPERAESAFVPDRSSAAGEVLCLQEERRVGNDNTVKWRGLNLQIPPSPLRPHFVRATVRVHEYPDGRLAVFHGPHRLADYDPRGNLRHDAKLAA